MSKKKKKYKEPTPEELHKDFTEYMNTYGYKIIEDAFKEDEIRMRINDNK
tara:strand:+ start:582 stop:731 length:150 start_codon:yes stop_codon:yes gene_type:complete